LNKHPGGRPTKYNSTLALYFGLLQINGRLSQAQALLFCGISLASIKRWKKIYPWFGQLIGAIYQGRQDFPHCFSERVLTRHRRKQGGTILERCPRGTPSKFRSEFRQYVKSSIRKTAKAIGVSPTTVYRWSNEHFLEFGAWIIIEKAKAIVTQTEKWFETFDARNKAK
jgi:hypothetical protein